MPITASAPAPAASAIGVAIDSVHLTGRVPGSFAGALSMKNEHALNNQTIATLASIVTILSHSISFVIRTRRGSRRETKNLCDELRERLSALRPESEEEG